MHGIDSLGHQGFYPDAEDPADSARPGSLKRKNEDDETQQPAKRGRRDDLPTLSEGDHSAPASTSVGGHSWSLTASQPGATEPQGADIEQTNTKINMKESTTERQRLNLPGGAAPLNARMADRIAKKYGENGMPGTSGHQVAERQPDGKWHDQVTQQPLSGRFIYARMNNGEIRLGSRTNGKNAHTALTGSAKSVAYAGEVEFDRGTITEYTNESGTYVPSAALRFQSGFGQGAGFRDADRSRGPFHQTTEAAETAEQAAESAARLKVERLRSDPPSEATDGQWRRQGTGKWEKG